MNVVSHVEPSKETIIKDELGQQSDLSDTIKLNNSDILNNLDDKLKHLPPSHQEDLKKILTEHKELFPDVPSRKNYCR